MTRRSTPSAAGLLALAAILLAGCGGSPDEAPPGDRSPSSAASAVARPDEAAPARGVDPATVATGPRLVERVLVLALDGATWDVFDPLLAAGEMPHLQRLMEAGVSASLETLEPTVSPAIWTTIATGFLPRHHGILGFDGVPGATMKTLPNARMRQRKAYWEILSDFGVSTGTVGWWATWPADPMAGESFLLSDRVAYTRMEAAVRRPTISPEDAWPRDLLERVAPLVERPDEISPDVVREFLKMDPEEMRRLVLDAEYVMGQFLPEFKYVYQSDRSTLKMATAVLEERPVDVASVYFTGIDTVCHLYWHCTWPERFERFGIPPETLRQFADVIPLYCRRMDDYLGELLAARGEGTTVIVVSDHGFGPTGNLPWSGGHGRLTPGAPIAPAGILVLAGPGIAPGPRRLERAHVLDVAPTLLHLLGVPPGEDMIGSVLTEALAADSADPPARVPSHETIGALRRTGDAPVDAPGDAERMERLRALGYIE